MNTVAPTSQAAYQHHVSSGNKQRQRALILEEISAQSSGFDYLFQGGGLTRRQISNITGIELGATAGRVNLLIKDGLLVDKGTVKCSTTGRMVGLVGLPE